MAAASHPDFAIEQIEHLLLVFAGENSLKPIEQWEVGAGIRYITRMHAMIERLTLPGSPYRDQAAAAREIGANNPIAHELFALRGILEALLADLEAGWTTTVVELLHADTFADFLDRATELLDKGYKDAAAVLAGSVLEVHLGALCLKHGVDTERPDGAPKGAEAMNVDLRKNGVYNQIEQKAVTADFGIRNAAAHGKYDEYDETQVRDLIRHVMEFLTRHPA